MADRLEASSASLQRAELIQLERSEPIGLDFRHPLIHEVAYGSLLPSTRRALHGRIGHWLEEHGGEDRVAELARHYRDSDDLAKARTYLPLAGRHAQSLSAIREAFGWFTDAAAAYADEPVKRAEMLESAARQITCSATSSRRASSRRRPSPSTSPSGRRGRRSTPGDG